MKVLIACIPVPKNKYMADLVEGLSTFCDVTWDCDEFWRMENEYDVVHVHWPEYLSFEIESYLANTKDLSLDLWERIEECCKHWHQTSTLVYTRHVSAPHKRNDDTFKRLYGLVFSYCYGIAHFANYSIKEFKAFFPDNQISLHKVIPQHKHTSLPDNSSKSSAREALNIGDKSKVLMCFGLIKENEKELINQAFEAINGKDKVLLAPGWKVPRRKITYIRLREWVWKFDKWMARLNKKRRIDLGFIPEESAHLYCNAADVILIPRTNELFSGNISLGFTFGKVVLGKNDSNIGEILEEYGNPTFEVNNLDSLKAAVNEAFVLSENGLGERNRVVADSEWSIEKITNYYQEFFELAHEEKTNSISLS